MEQDSERIKAEKERLMQQYKDSVSFESDTIVSVLVKKIQEVTELINTANHLTEKSFDTISISENLPVTEHLLSIIESEFISKNSLQNLRALKTAKRLLTQSEEQLESWQNILFNYTDEFANIKVSLSEASKDSTFRKMPEDSLLRDMYFEQVARVVVSWRTTDSVININMLQIGLLQNRVSSAFLRAKDYLDKTNYKLNKYIQDLWLPEEPSLLKASESDYDISLADAYKSSGATVVNLIAYYFEINTHLWVSSLIIILALYGWFLYMISRLKKGKLYSAELRANSKILTRYPLLSATGLVLTLISIFFFNLPPSWNSLVWIILAIIYFVLSRFRAKTRKAFRPEFIVIFLIFISFSILLKNSFAERWVQFFLDLVNISYGIFMLRQLLKNEPAYPTYTKAGFFCFYHFICRSFNYKQLRKFYASQGAE
jgi:hypothetical protein